MNLINDTIGFLVRIVEQNKNLFGNKSNGKIITTKQPVIIVFIVMLNGPIKNVGLLLINGHWIAEAPFTDTAGFHISALYSPWVSISTIVKDYLEARKTGPERMKTWVNTTLGLPFEEDLQQTPATKLIDRAEDFSIDRIPNEVVYLTIGGDTQDDRVELTLLGWGLKQECYVLRTSCYSRQYHSK